MNPAVEHCACSHAKGDHKSSGSTSLSIRWGRCFECDCIEFTPRPSDPLGEIARLRAGIQWVRGMCSDGEPVDAIDAKLGEVLRDAA